MVYVLLSFSSHKKGISSHQLRKDIKVTQKTAWFIIHRLRYAFDHPNFKTAVGGDNTIVELDECGVGGQSYYKHANKIKRNEDGAVISGKASVMGMRERGGNIKAMVVPDRNIVAMCLPACKARNNINDRRISSIQRFSERFSTSFS